MNDQRSDSTGTPRNDTAAGEKKSDPPAAILAQFHTAEYSAIMARISLWENLQYTAWGFVPASLALLANMQHIPGNIRLWVAVIVILVVYVAYQGTMINMLSYVLLIERHIRPRARNLVGGNDDFWIHERVRERTFPTNPAWWPYWPAVISILAIALVAGGLFLFQGFQYEDGLFCAVASGLAWFVVILTRNGERVRQRIVKACKTSDIKIQTDDPETS